MLTMCGPERRQSALPKLHLKAVSYAGTDMLSPDATAAREIGAEYVEALASHIIEQALSLRENAPLKNMKRKAFAGLLKRLKLIGLRGAFAVESTLSLSRCLTEQVPGHQLGAINTAVAAAVEAGANPRPDTSRMLHCIGLTACFAAVADEVEPPPYATAASTATLGSETWVRADIYFHRIIFRLHRMRRLSNTFSAELSSAEVRPTVSPAAS